MSERMSCQLRGIFRGRQQEEDTTRYIYNACICLKKQWSLTDGCASIFFSITKRYVMAVQVQVRGNPCSKSGLFYSKANMVLCKIRRRLVLKISVIEAKNGA